MGHKTVCLNKYVEAAYASPGAFKAANLNKSATKRERAVWKRKKEEGRRTVETRSSD